MSSHPAWVTRGALIAVLTTWMLAGTCRAASIADESKAVFTNRLEAFRTLVDATYPHEADGMQSHARSQIFGALAGVESNFQSGDYDAARNSFSNMRSYTQEKALRTEFKQLQAAYDAAVKADLQEIVNRAEAALAGLPALCDATGETLEDYQGRLAASLSELSRSRTSEHAGSKIQVLRDKVVNAQGLIKALAALAEQKQSGNPAEALRQLNRLAGNSSYQLLMPADCIANLRTSLTASVEQAVDTRLAEVVRQLAEARTVADVQQLAHELQPFYERYSSEGSVQVRLEGMRVSVAIWQNVLTAEQAGDTLGALRAMQERTGRSSGFEVLPPEIVQAKRSALLTQILQAPGSKDPTLIAVVDHAVQQVTSLEELLALGPRLRNLLNAGSVTGAEEIGALAADIQALAAGTAGTGARRGIAQHRWQPIITRYANQQQLSEIANVTRLEGLRFEREGQTADELLLALADKAAAKSDWERVIGLLDAYRHVVRGGLEPEWLRSELEGCRAFVAGQHLEAAGEFESAMTHYRTVLESIGTRVPRAQASKRLVALRQLLAAHMALPQ